MWVVTLSTAVAMAVAISRVEGKMKVFEYKRARESGIRAVTQCPWSNINFVREDEWSNNGTEKEGND